MPPVQISAPWVGADGAKVRMERVAAGPPGSPCGLDAAGVILTTMFAFIASLVA